MAAGRQRDHPEHRLCALEASAVRPHELYRAARSCQGNPELLQQPGLLERSVVDALTSARLPARDPALAERTITVVDEQRLHDPITQQVAIRARGTHVAPFVLMRFVRKLLGIGLLAASVVYLRRRRRVLRGPSAARGPSPEEVRFDDTVGTSVASTEDLFEIATRSGIADVDPLPISHVAGEGIDPVRDIEAHTSIAESRERMPRP